MPELHDKPGNTMHDQAGERRSASPFYPWRPADSQMPSRTSAAGPKKSATSSSVSRNICISTWWREEWER